MQRERSGIGDQFEVIRGRAVTLLAGDIKRGQRVAYARLIA
jgi:hypothetical protein